MEVLGGRLDVGAVDRQEMDVGIAAHPARGRARPSSGGWSSWSSRCPGLDPDACPERLVLEAADDLDEDIALGQPPLAAAVDDRVRDGAEPDVAAHVHVPARQVGC